MEPHWISTTITAETVAEWFSRVKIGVNGELGEKKRSDQFLWRFTCAVDERSGGILSLETPDVVSEVRSSHALAEGS